MSIEAMRLALDALESASNNEGNFYDYEYAATALRQAIEQTEDVEPFAVAWAMDGELFWPSEYEVIAQEGDGAQPLYTASPKREWVGLTDDEVNEFAAGCHLGNSVQGAIYKAQAKLKEKNA